MKNMDKVNLRPLKSGNGGEFKNLVGSYSVFILVITSPPLLHPFLFFHKDGDSGGRIENKV